MANEIVRQGRCQLCGNNGEVVEVSYRQNTGMLVMRQTRTLDCMACRACSGRAFRRMTLHTLFLGWWGTISFFVTPLYLINNIFFFVRTMKLRNPAIEARSRLDEQRDYALALLATKDEATVVEVLTKSSGASDGEVRAFVRKLRGEIR